MKAGKKILITGAGIAGPACAYWLQHYGYSVVIAEKAKALRDGGQNIDIKGAGQLIIKKMGIVEKIIAKNTMEQGQRYIDAAGKLVAAFPKGAFGSLTADFEILRGDLATIMFDATRDTCEYRFQTFVTGLEETAHAISVRFNDGSVEDFEFVICAEGIGSTTRDMVLPDQTHFRYLGAYLSFFKIPRRPEDDNWVKTVNGIGGTFINVRPGQGEETTVLVTFPRKDPDISANDFAARRELLIQALRGRGTLADRIIEELDAVRDFYFGPMSQVQASTWSKGRFVMLGDAAHCPTAFTGEGTPLALVGAYVLAGEIRQNTTYSDAFITYEKLVRPYVEASQKQISPLLIRLIHVKSPLGILFMRLIQKFLASGIVQKLLKPSDAKREINVAKDFDLPTYS